MPEQDDVKQLPLRASPARVPLPPVDRIYPPGLVAAFFLVVSTMGLAACGVAWLAMEVISR